MSRTLKGIRKRQQIARAALQSLEEQQSQVHLLAGAIATSRARRKSNRLHGWREDYSSLREFRRVLQVRTHDRDAVAKECEAFQLLRLGRRPEALQAYADLEAIAETIGDVERRDLTIARAKRFRAQILQANAADGGAGAAWTLIASQQNAECSVKLRERYGPFAEWEAIEQAEIHFVAAWIAHKLGFGIEEPAHLSRAEAAYGEILVSLPKRSWFVPFIKKRLRDEAREGQQRVDRAKAGNYDKDWLLV